MQGCNVPLLSDAQISCSVVCLSVTRVYCNKTAKVRIMQFSLPGMLDDKIRRGPLDLGAQIRVWVLTSHAISRKLSEIELR